MASSLYIKLDSTRQQIRLIRLDPVPDRIQCELFVTSLDYHPSYEALSYVWGPSKLSRSIHLNGSDVGVTDNLYSALCRLQPLREPRMLWIDQLCIDQSDKDECGQQVQLMGKIYATSAQTVLWLGDNPHKDAFPVPPDQIHVPDTVPCTWTLAKADSDDCIVWSYQPSFPSSQGQGGEDPIFGAFALIADLANSKVLDDIPYLSSPDSSTVDNLRALWLLMHKPWWGRVWTLQECLIPPSPLVMYGPVVAPFEMFLAAASSFTHQAALPGFRPPEHFSQADATILRHFGQALTDIDSYRKRQQHGETIDLTSALRQFRVREATDDRDKIYGLLGLRINWHGEAPLKPNYTRDTSHVYRDVTLKLVRGTQSLKILINSFNQYGDSRKTGRGKAQPSLAVPASMPPELQSVLAQIESWTEELHQEPFFIDLQGSHVQLPSWVPDWSGSTSFELLSRYNQAELYAAARDTPAGAKIVEDSILALSGFEMDTVRWSSQIMAHTGGEPRSSLLKDWQAFSADAVAYQSRPSSKIKSPSSLDCLSPLEDAFWRTICGDTVVCAGPSYPHTSFRRCTRQDYQSFLSWCRTFEPGLLPSPVSSENSSHTKTLPQDGIESLVAEPSAAIEPAVRAATSLRRLFITRRGFLGLGPPQTIGGEKVFVLRGGSVPFILRSATSKVTGKVLRPLFELVGDCYVHGIMDGEAMDWDLPETNLFLV